MKFLLLDGKDNSYEYIVSSEEKCAALYTLVKKDIPYQFALRDEVDLLLNEEYYLYKYFGRDNNILIKLQILPTGFSVYYCNDCGCEHDILEDSHIDEDEKKEDDPDLDEELEDELEEESELEEEDCGHPLCNIFDGIEDIIGEIGEHELILHRVSESVDNLQRNMYKCLLIQFLISLIFAVLIGSIQN